MGRKTPCALYLWTNLRQPTWSRGRGKLVAEFASYGALVKEAQRRAVAAGYPASRWMDLFDWATLN